MQNSGVASLFSSALYNQTHHALFNGSHALSAMSKKLFSLMLALGLCLLAAPARAFDYVSACLFIDSAGLHPMPDGSLTDVDAEADQQHLMQLTRDARARIEATFGAPEARPIVVFFKGRDGFGKYHLNPYGNTQFIGSRACVMIGPEGQNVDVVAHELMHAELNHRAGTLKRALQIPTWFDEGLAMQVDYRPRYRISAEAMKDADGIRECRSYDAFFSHDPKTVVEHYTAARYVVGQWLEKVGQRSVYDRLQRMSQGESFHEAMEE
ncbi:MAG: hypothetical protein ACRCTU_17580 [Zoogloea sp.]|uniref:hypothetical protein n=1 Tax=Zoogloea sp. TaxID=49181 RepID=UPI003F3E74FD